MPEAAAGLQAGAGAGGCSASRDADSGAGGASPASPPSPTVGPAAATALPDFLSSSSSRASQSPRDQRATLVYGTPARSLPGAPAPVPSSLSLDAAAGPGGPGSSGGSGVAAVSYRRGRAATEGRHGFGAWF